MATLQPAASIFRASVWYVQPSFSRSYFTRAAMFNSAVRGRLLLRGVMATSRLGVRVRLNGKTDSRIGLTCCSVDRYIQTTAKRDQHFPDRGVVMEAEFLTTEEVAEWCRTSPSTVHYWKHMGRGPRSARVGKRVLYRRTDVEAWITDLYATEAFFAASSEGRR
ncbi:helix-turn-helix transcriptional regulator [Demequina sp. SO4-13]|uniref:helix-turn-helix transcriptional regulator n=1 Tax=Demequina sp. SO4-13 TaxID=3401027 RepID=UPI003AF52DBE